MTTDERRGRVSSAAPSTPARSADEHDADQPGQPTSSANARRPAPAGRFAWERAVHASTLPRPLRLTALTLASYADADGTGVRPGESRLAADAYLSTRSVRRHLVALRQAGFLAQSYRGGGRPAAGTPGRAAEYRLTVPVGTPDTLAGESAETPANLSGVQSETPDTLAGVEPETPDTLAAESDETPDTGDQNSGHGCPPTNQDHEEKELPPTGAPSSRKRSDPTRGHRIPSDWFPDEADREWFALECPDLNGQGRQLTDTFRDYWLSKAGAGARKTDWSRTWRVWMRREQRDAAERANRRARPSSRPSSDEAITAFLSGGASAPDLIELHGQDATVLALPQRAAR